MSELVKWQETNAGKYSIFDIELGDIKTTISCDTDNSENLILLLKELEHTHTSINEENEKLKNKIKASVILTEAEKSTLILMREQIDTLLPRYSEEMASIIDSKGGIPELKRLAKLGYLQKDIAEMWGISAARVSMYVSEHGLSWRDMIE